MSVADLKNVLKNCKNDSSDGDLYDHLIDTFMKILLDKSSTSFNNFENISSIVKDNPPKLRAKSSTDISDDKKRVHNMKLSWTNKVMPLLSVPTEPLALEIECPDLLHDFNLLEWANISLGKSDAYKLNLSIRSLAASLPSDVQRLRFFGKISTKSQPYMILEGLSTDDDFNDEIDESKQEGKSGVNKYSYWISQSVSSKNDEWVKLPNVSMEQIVLARDINRLFTGKLDEPVPSFPPFPGTEKNLLRAKIALILGSTAISPEGFYDLDEDSDEPIAKLADAASLLEKQSKTSADLKSSENWKHHELEINEIGRITSLPEVEEEENANDEKDVAEVPKPLSDVKADKWSFRVCPGGAGENDLSYVAAKSFEWPGGVCVGNGKTFVNAYIGYGIKFNNTKISPPIPANIEAEFEPISNEVIDVIADPSPPVEETNKNEEEEVNADDEEES